MYTEKSSMKLHQHDMTTTTIDDDEFNVIDVLLKVVIQDALGVQIDSLVGLGPGELEMQHEKIFFLIDDWGLFRGRRDGTLFSLLCVNSKILTTSLQFTFGIFATHQLLTPTFAYPAQVVLPIEGHKTTNGSFLTLGVSCIMA
ncbi:hypothetical protein K435DRAFT_792940 [Dendrothele bispora CBS 962.96]|uniref:Uncharacterized protein n=1 Tax=Dendrothele bispora (strain CBS 962.96) TaxID=1314807 RepID=A0A4S8MI06_DENBC|nr:hypothetical protein K435DRAFT_792940 [Dendrothele bispora CBS 962.96]